MGNRSSIKSSTDMIVPRSFALPRRPKMGSGIPQLPNSRWKPSRSKQKDCVPYGSKPEISPHKVAYGSSTYMARQNRMHTVPYTADPLSHPANTTAPTVTQTTMAMAAVGGCQTTPASRPISLPRPPDASSVGAVAAAPPVASRHSTGDTYRRWSQKYVALHDYTARVEDDLSILKGQHFYVIDRSQGYWWYAKCAATGKMGYVPFNYLAPITSLESNEWHFGDMRRLEAENCLMMPGNDHGSFLVRISESRSGEYSLSVRDGDVVKHYRIRSRPSRTNPEVRRYFISRQLPFSSIQQLVEHYMKNQSGLCCELIAPCIKPVHPVPVGLSHNTVDKWEIPKSSVVLKERIGKGQFGEVYKAVWNGTTLVAVKTLRANLCNAEDFLMEAQTMKRLHHPHLIQLYAVCTQSAPFYLITELMSKGSLLAFLQSAEGRALGVAGLALLAVQVASGMAYLESQRYVHRDLAARNCLVGEGNVVKIGDFGLARMIHNQEYVAHAGARFPIKWTAPEAANYSRFTTASDIWSFGILLTEIVTYGRVPYPGMHNAEVLRQVEAGYRMPAPPGCPVELYDLMLECWAADETARPSFASIHGRLQVFCEEWDRPAYRDPATATSGTAVGVGTTSERCDSPPPPLPLYRRHVTARQN
ncbi:Tyrosine-protein kinase Src42A [Echinococcus granulosus]|uniref:Tyrosine-protein kinase n=1 Tax=Echinococcus granulosus TaxID=6210 RepID=A0A068WER0_ECHGR|nr:Tyrosine-protein kinase Src42A [Echinococcus granulosus]CDS18226.1 tyrosine protein kinase Src42A [Echinococcus granulosus]